MKKHIGTIHMGVEVSTLGEMAGERPAIVDLDELEKLLEKATARPWHSGHTQDGIFAADACVAPEVRHLPDEMLIPVAINALPAMIAELRGLREALRDYDTRRHEGWTPATWRQFWEDYAAPDATKKRGG